MTSDARSSEPPADDPHARRQAKHWAWFVRILTTLGVLGFGASIVLMLPLGMASDGCFPDSTRSICTMGARGQNILVLIPWMCLIAGCVLAVAGAAVADRFRRTPLIGIPVGMAAYFAVIPIGYAVALYG